VTKLCAAAVLVMGALALACGDPSEEPGTQTLPVIETPSQEPVPDTPTVMPIVTEDIGPFRLLSGGTAERKFAAPLADVSDVTDLGVIEASTLFVQPGLLGAGAELTSATALVASDEVVAIDEFLNLESAGGPRNVQITRWKGLAQPIEVNAPVPGGPLTAEEGMVSGNPALFLRGDDQLLTHDVWFVEGDVVTFIRAAGDLATVVALAESVAQAD
jgi:hypothetical protein